MTVNRINIPKDTGLEIFVSNFAPIDSKMYAMIYQNESIIVDPNIDMEVFKLLSDRNVEKVTVLITHGHYDHISGINKLRELFNCTVVANELSTPMLSSATKNLSKFYEMLFWDFPEEVREYVQQQNVQPYTCTADIVFNEIYDFDFHGKAVHIQSTPGHTKDSVCITVDENIIFTGDSLIPGSSVITRFPTGNRNDWLDITWQYLQTLPQNVLVLPGHGEAVNLGELLNETQTYITVYKSNK